MSVNERRLKVVYDALDDCNNKKAIQEINKILKKDPNFVTAKVFKGIALHRLGRPDEAESIIQPIENSSPTEESVLSALLSYYKETRLTNRFSKLLENACKKLPENELYRQWLFNCHVRDHNIKGQMEVSRFLNKAHPENELYFFFVLMSTLVQGRNDPTLAERMYYPLTEKMLNTMAAKRALSLGETYLLFELYKLSGKYETLLTYVDEHKNLTSSGDILLRPAERIEIIRTCLVQRVASNDNQWQNYRERYLKELHDFLLEAPDDAQQWGRYIDCCLNHPSAPLGSGEVNSESIASLHALLAIDRGSLRGPYIARLHYQSRLQELYPDCSERYPHAIFSIHDVIIEFFKKFSSRPSCALDLIEQFTMYHNLHCNDEELLRKLEAVVPERIEQVNDSYSLANYETMCQYLRRYDQFTAKQLLDKANHLLNYYRQTLKIVESLPTEHNPGDAFLCLLVNLLFHCHQKAGATESAVDFSLLGNYLLGCVTLLESAVQCDSPSNHNLRLRLVRLYQLLGAYSTSVTHFKPLDVKQLLLESMSYFLTDFSLRMGHISHAVSQWTLMANHLKSTFYELDESLTVAYKERNARQILQFIDFRRRLQNSLTFNSAQWNKVAVELLWSCHSFPQVLDCISENELSSKLVELNELPTLVDGRDFSTVVDPFRRVHDKEVVFNNELKWIQFRRLTCSCIVISSKLVMDNAILIDKLKTNGKHDTCGCCEDNVVETTAFQQLRQRLESLTQLIGEGGSAAAPLLMETLTTLFSPVPSLFESYKRQPYTSIIVQGGNALLQLRSIILKQDLPVCLNLGEALVRPLESLSGELVKCMEKHSRSECAPFVDVQFNAVILTEAVSITLLFLSMFHSCLLPLLSSPSVSASSKRKAGKKRGKGDNHVSNSSEATSNNIEQEVAPAASTESPFTQRLQPLVSEWQECMTRLVNWLQEEILGATGVWHQLSLAIPQTQAVLKNQNMEKLCQQFASVQLNDDHLERLSETSLISLTEKIVNNIGQDRCSSLQQLRLVLQSKLQAAIAIQKGNGLDVPPTLQFVLPSDGECGFTRR